MEFKCPACNHVLNEYEINNLWCTTCNKRFGSKEEIFSLNEEWVRQQAENKAIEEQRQEYGLKQIGHYEYDVETVLNVDHGRTDKDSLRDILNTRARAGWKLHTMYSNELGKDAIKVLGFGLNSTVCEDVLIFERQIEK